MRYTEYGVYYDEPATQEDIWLLISRIENIEAALGELEERLKSLEEKLGVRK